MPTTTFKTGVTDTAAGAGVSEYLGLSGGLAALSQAVTPLPMGDPWCIRGSASFTPTLITDTFPAATVMAWRVPAGKALLFTGGYIHSLAASIEFYRVSRRYFMYGYQATAAPAAPAAPTTVSFSTAAAGLETTGAYTYKVAPIDSFGRESAITAASTPSLTPLSTIRGITVTPPALPTGAIGYNVYRTLAGGATYYYVGTTLGATAYDDVLPDAGVTAYGLLQPSATWATGAITGETADGPCELILEVGGVALTGTTPTGFVYSTYASETKRSSAITSPTAIGGRVRVKMYGEASPFVPVGVVAGRANLWRGLGTTDARTDVAPNHGAVSVGGPIPNTAPATGCYMVWGHQVIGVGQRGADPAAGTAHAYAITPTNPHGVLIPPYGEICVEVGALAVGVAGVRDVALTGMLIPTTGT